MSSLGQTILIMGVTPKIKKLFHDLSYINKEKVEHSGAGHQDDIETAVRVDPPSLMEKELY